MSFEKKLAKANAAWKKAKKQKPEYDNVITDGIYTGKLVRAEMGESQSKGRLQVAWKVVVGTGEFKGENITWWSGLETENNIMYFQRDLARLGKEVPEDASEIEGVLKELEKEKPTIRVQVKTNGEFQNVRIMKLVDAESSEDAEETEDADDEEVEEDEEEQEEAEESDEDDDEEEAEEKPAKAEKADEEEEEESEDDDSDESEDADDDEDADDEEDDDDAEEAEAPEVEQGMRVAFSYKGKDLVGTVKKINYEKGIVIVITDKGLKLKLKPEALSPAPTTKVKKSK